MELFKLFGSIMVDNKKANESINKTDSLASKVSKTLGNGIKTAAKWGVGIAAGITAGGAALMGIANKAAETADRIDKLSQKTNLSKKGFQEWDHIMSQSGADILSLQAGMKKLTGAMDDANNGGKNATASFKKLGISAEALKKMSPEQAFEATVKALQKMPQGAERASLATDLLGKSSIEMAAILNMTAEETEALRKEAHDLGLVMSDESVTAGVVFGDIMANVKASLGQVFTKIGIELMPLIQRFAEWIIANMPTIQAVVGVVFTYISQIVTGAVGVFNDYLLPAIMGIYNFINENWTTISTVFTTVFDGVKLAIDFIVDIFNNFLLPAIQSIVNWVKDNWGTIREVISSVFDSVKIIFDTFVNYVKILWDAFGKHIIDFISNAFNTIKNVVSGALTVIQGIIKTVTSLIKGDWAGVWEGIKQIFRGVWQSITGIVTGAVNTVKGIIGGAWNGIKSVTSTIWGGIKTAITTPITAAKDFVKGAIDTIKGLFNFKFKWPKLPMPHFSIVGSINPLEWLSEGVPRLSVEWYAKGGIFSKPTIFNTPYGAKGIGEAGPEAVAPISKLQDMIDWNNGIDPKIMEKIIALLEIIAGKSDVLVIEGKKVAKAIAPYVDKEFQLMKARG